MDTNKIRGAQALIDEARHRGHNIPQLVEAARLLKAELDVAPDENDGWQRATLVIGDERVFTESEVNELIKAGNAMSVAMHQYQMDVDDDPPQKHRDMMNAWESAVRHLSDPA